MAKKAPAEPIRLDTKRGEYYDTGPQEAPDKINSALGSERMKALRKEHEAMGVRPETK